MFAAVRIHILQCGRSPVMEVALFGLNHHLAAHATRRAGPQQMKYALTLVAGYAHEKNLNIRSFVQVVWNVALILKWFGVQPKNR